MENTDALPQASRSLRGARALVTGATSGIGFEIARQLLATGAVVWVAGRTLAKSAEAVAALGAGAQAVQLDVTDPGSVSAAAERIDALDVLVNNAGVNPGGEGIDTAPLDQLRAAYETNVFGLVHVTQALLPALRRSAHPRIVNVSSGTGSLAWTAGPNPQFDWERVQGGGLAYRSSKTAVNAVTLLTAQALGDGFKVNALAPGLRRTNLVHGMSAGGDPAEAARGALLLAALPDDGPTGSLWSWDGTRVPW